VKVTGVLGSPRSSGVSSTVARRFLEYAAKSGATTGTYNLAGMHYSGCRACERCKIDLKSCALKDDLTPLLRDIHDTDLLLLASPVYYGEVSGQFKTFFDRTFSYFESDFSCRIPAGKKAVIILAQANPDSSMFDDIFPRYKHWLEIYGFSRIELIRMCGVESIETDGTLEKECLAAEKLAEEMLES